jgi:hypothetical protein
VPGFNNGITISAVISPLLLALGAGLGIADAVPIVRVETVPRELNPTPVTVTVSSTEAEAALKEMLGLGTENAVVVPVIDPIIAETIVVPGFNDPPVVFAGTSMIASNPPEASDVIPPAGIALAVPNVKVVADVLGGKPVPVKVTSCPVEAERGLAVTVPLGIFTETCLVLLAALAP